MKDSLNASGYPRAISSIIVSVGLLAVFITFASWVLLSFPIGTAVSNYFYSFEDTASVGTLVSWQNTTQSEVHKNENTTADAKDGKYLQQSKDSLDADENQEDKDKKKEADITPSDVRNNEKTTPASHDGQDSQQSKDGEVVVVNQEGKDKKEADIMPSDVRNNEKTAPAFQDGQDSQQSKDGDVMAVNQEGKDNQAADDGKTNLPKTQDTDKTDNRDTVDSHPPSPPIKECDLFHGEWYYDQSGPLYTNNSCPIITQMQNCQGNGRPDKGYESWRWRPSECELPRFDANKFLDLMRGKTLAFVGDSVARNQMESLLCILWQVEAPKNRGNRQMQRWFFGSRSVMIVRIWSSWLVHQTPEPFKYAPEGITKVYLDIPDETFMQHIPKFDVVVLSSGHWFAKKSVYIQNNEIVGTQLWSPPDKQKLPINSVEAFAISVDTILTAMATHPNYTGITILRSYSPDHYEGGAWNTGGSCTGKTEPLHPGQLVENGFTNIMHQKQVHGFNLAAGKHTNKSKLKLMDITEVFSYRHDGHPGPFRNPDPNKVTKRGPKGQPPPQDCLHWCMPGPIDTWNEFVLEIIRRDVEK